MIQFNSFEGGKVAKVKRAKTNCGKREVLHLETGGKGLKFISLAGRPDGCSPRYQWRPRKHPSEQKREAGRQQSLWFLVLQRAVGKQRSVSVARVASKLGLCIITGPGDLGSGCGLFVLLVWNKELKTECQPEGMLGTPLRS